MTRQACTALLAFFFTSTVLFGCGGGGGADAGAGTAGGGGAFAPPAEGGVADAPVGLDDAGLPVDDGGLGADGVMTPACGGPGFACCPGNACTGGGCCVQGVCAAPGAVCGALGGVCSDGVCGTCGGAGMACCSAVGATATCTAAATRCSSGLCVVCGSAGLPCCSGSGESACLAAGLVCNGTTCVAGVPDAGVGGATGGAGAGGAGGAAGSAGTGGAGGKGGTGASGGTAGTGGAGGTGASGGIAGGAGGSGACKNCSPGQTCAAEASCILPGTVDDFGSCDANIYAAEGRSGTWYGYMGDGVYCATPPCAGFGVVPWGLGACGAWTRGGLYDDFGDVYAGVGVGLNKTGVTYDACGYDSIEVTYATDQAIRMYAKWNYTGDLGSRSYVLLPATDGTTTTTVKLSSFTGLICSKLTEFQFEPSIITEMRGFGVAIYGLRFLGSGASPGCTSGQVRCASSSVLETCVGGVWSASSCSTGRTCVGGACVAGGTPVEQHGNLSVKGTKLVDESGNPVQLKGVSSQWLNYESDGYATNLSALIWMRDNWKLSVIRAAMGVDEDQTGAYMTSTAAKANMLSQVETIIQNAVAAGVYVIVDWHSHQAEQYTTEANLFFRDISQRYGQYPNVIYETYNEPLKVAWTTLKQYHQNVYTSIRSYDADRNENVILLGTPNWDQDVDVAALNPMAGDTNIMYTLHFYACSHNSYYGQLAKAKTALSLGLPIFVSEWGATTADGGEDGTSTCPSYADEWHTWMDANNIGWVAWKLDDCDGLTVPDTSCILKRGAPVSGGWTSSYLAGHGAYVVSKLTQ